MVEIPGMRKPDKIDRRVSNVIATLVIVLATAYFAGIGYMAYKETPTPTWWPALKERLWK